MTAVSCQTVENRVTGQYILKGYLLTASEGRPTFRTTTSKGTYLMQPRSYDNIVRASPLHRSMIFVVDTVATFYHACIHPQSTTPSLFHDLKA